MRLTICLIPHLFIPRPIRAVLPGVPPAGQFTQMGFFGLWPYTIPRHPFSIHFCCFYRADWTLQLVCWCCPFLGNAHKPVREASPPWKSNRNESRMDACGFCMALGLHCPTVGKTEVSATLAKQRHLISVILPSSKVYSVFESFEDNAAWE